MKQPTPKTETLVALVRDRPGVLNRAVNIFRRRGLNIESLTVAPSERPGISRLTIVAEVADVDRLLPQFERLIEVVQVSRIDAPTTPFHWQADGASDDVV